MNYSKNQLNIAGNKNSLAVYIHWPFCQFKCPYCDFNSHVRDAIDQKLWMNSYMNAIGSYEPLLKNRTITSIFFGGGTPSLADPELIGAVIDKLATLGSFSDCIEITLEANPTSTEVSKLSAIGKLGVNRVSLGIQSFYEKNLKFLGRKHSAQEGIAAIKKVADNFENYSFDLIYALPEQELKEWEKELLQAITLVGNHISLYQLTIEDGTLFAKHAANGNLIPMDADEAATFYNLTQQIVVDNGLPAYEISNHAKKGKESKHNLTYWRYGDYIGIGPGAHGRYTISSLDEIPHHLSKLDNLGQFYNSKIATYDWKIPEKWLGYVDRVGHGIESFEKLSDYQMESEKLLMGLRLNEGLLIDNFKNLNYREIINLEDQGFLTLKDNRMSTTSKGVLVLDSIIKRIFHY